MVMKSRLSEAERAMQTAEGSAAQREAIVAFKDLEFQYEAKMAYWNDILEEGSNCGNRFSQRCGGIRNLEPAADVVVADDLAEFSLLEPSRPNTNNLRDRRILYGQPVDATAIIWIDEPFWAAGSKSDMSRSRTMMLMLGCGPLLFFEGREGPVVVVDVVAAIEASDA